MRNKERINVFLEKVDYDKLFQKWNYTEKPADFEITEELKDYWLENYDQRFGQMLINNGVIQDTLGAWVDEESDILIYQGVEPREFLLWGSIYDKDNNLLDEVKHRFIKDMDTDHIEKILELFEEKLDPLYRETFENELELRESYNVMALDIENEEELEY